MFQKACDKASHKRLFFI